MNNPNSLSGGEKENTTETGHEEFASFEEHLKNEGLKSNSEELPRKTSEEKAEELDSLKSDVLSHYEEKEVVDSKPDVPKAKREELYDPDSEEVTRDPGKKPMSEEAVKRGERAKRAIDKYLDEHGVNRKRDDNDPITEHMDNIQKAFNDLINIDEVNPDVIELGEGSLGKLQVIEKALSRDEYTKLLAAVNTPVLKGYNDYEAAVNTQLEQTLKDIKNEAWLDVEKAFTVKVKGGEEVTESISGGAKEIARGKLALARPRIARRTPSEVLAQEDEDNRLRSGGARTLESFRIAARDKKIEPTSEERKVLDHISEIEKMCNLSYDCSEARSMCYDLRKDLGDVSGTDFSKAVKMLAKLEKKMQKQEKKLQKKLGKIDFDSLEGRVNAIE